MTKNPAAFSKGPGLKIKGSRLRKGWSISELARESGVSKSNLSRIEAGQIRVSAAVAKAVSTVLDIEIGDLVGDIPFRELATVFGVESEPVQTSEDKPKIAAGEKDRWFCPAEHYSGRELPEGVSVYRVTSDDLAPRMFVGDLVTVASLDKIVPEDGDTLLLNTATGVVSAKHHEMKMKGGGSAAYFSFPIPEMVTAGGKVEDVIGVVMSLYRERKTV